MHRHPTCTYLPSVVHHHPILTYHLLKTRMAQGLKNGLVVLPTGRQHHPKVALSQNLQFEHENSRQGRRWPKKKVSIGTYYASGGIPRGGHHELSLLNGCMRRHVPLPISYIVMNFHERRKEQKRTSCSISATDGLAFFRHWARVPFSIYGVTRNNRDGDSSM